MTKIKKDKKKKKKLLDIFLKAEFAIGKQSESST
jgi:hypothetical protein